MQRVCSIMDAAFQPPFVYVDSLTKSYPSTERSVGGRITVVQDLSFSCEEASFTTMFGPNGCGKSTILNILAGIVQQDHGTVSVGRQTIQGQKVGYVFQDFRSTLFPWRRVIDNIGYPLELAGVSHAERREISKRLLERFGINLPMKNYPYQISGGQQQLTSIARAMIADPVLLLLDEPLSALDYETRFFMQQKILDIWHETRTTILFISHELDEAIYLADRVIFLTKRPARIKAVLPVELCRPRKPEMMESEAFMRLRAEGLRIFREVLDERG